MKKLLWIVVLGLLLSSNAYAATNIYLSCPMYITEDNSDDVISEVFSETNGFVAQIYANIKISSSNIKLKLYLQSPAMDDDWTNKKPVKTKIKFKGSVEDNHYYFEGKTKESNNQMTSEGYTNYDFYKKEGEWFLDAELYGVASFKKSYLKKLEKISKDLALELKNVTTDFTSYENICLEYDKKEFKNIIKKGILKAEDF